MRWMLLLVSVAVAASGCRSPDRVASASDGTLEKPYIAIQETLAEDNLKDLPKLGALVIQAAQTQGSEPGLDSMIRGAGKIAAQDIATARMAFKTMSDGLIAYMLDEPARREGYMIVHCPMTFAGAGGHWVQRSGPIMNPYEGAMMLHCGDKVSWEDMSTIVKEGFPAQADAPPPS